MEQPEMVRAEVRESGACSNSFGRQANALSSKVLIKNGLLSSIAQHDFLPKHSLAARNFLVTDSMCDDTFAVKVMRSFEAAGVTISKLVVECRGDESKESSTEPVKMHAVFTDLTNEIQAQGITKNSCIISLGGGVVHSMCGLLAATLYRGIPLILITTTTMGAFDAAIDFKQTVDHPFGNNLLGVSYPASKIAIDPEAFRALSPRHTRNGVALALKHGFTQSQKLIDVIVSPILEHGESALNDPEYLSVVCRECVQTKVLTPTWCDESNFNETVPQYGHAFGHAIEHLSWHPAESEYHIVPALSPLLYGEALSVGMAVSAEVSWLMGLCDDECVARHYAYSQAIGLPAYVPENVAVKAIIAKMGYDKHHISEPSMSLCAAIGKMANANESSYSWEVPVSVMEEALRRNIAKREMLLAPPRSPRRSYGISFEEAALDMSILAMTGRYSAPWHVCKSSSVGAGLYSKHTRITPTN